MRIQGWNVDGFGLLSDFETTDLPTGLTLFLGPNEAGKSTLLDFIRVMLFGPQRSDRKRPPVYSGRHGGQLLLEEHGTVYTIRRSFEGKGSFQLRGADDTPGLESDLAHLIGNCDRDVFRTIFAFSLTELNALSDLKGGDISDRLYSAGIAGAGKSARDVIKDLAERQSKLMGERSTNRAAAGNQLIAEAASIQQQLYAARSQARMYTQVCDRAAELDQDVQIRRRAIDDQRRAHQRVTRLSELWPVWLRQKDATEKLSILPEINDFPTDAIRRLEQALAECQRTRHDHKVRSEDQERRVRERDNLGPDAKLASRKSDITALWSELSTFRNNLAEIQTLHSITSTKQAALNQALSQLGPNWDRGRLKSFNTSIPQRDEVRRWESTLMEADNAVEAAALERRTIQKDFNQIEEELTRHTGKLNQLPLPPEIVLLDERDHQIGAMRSARAEFIEAEVRSQADQRALSAFAGRIGAEAIEESGNLPVWLAPVIAIAGLIFLSLAGWFYREDQGNRWQLFAAAGAVLVLTAVAIKLFEGMRRTANIESARRRRVDSEALVGARQEADESRALADSRRARMIQFAQSLGLGDEVALDEIEQLARRTIANRNDRIDYDRVIADVNSCEQKRDALTRPRVLVEGTLAAAVNERSELQGRWQQWLRDQQIPSEMKPPGVIEFFGTIGEARRIESDLVEVEQRNTDVRTAARHFSTRALEILADVGEPRPENSGQLNESVTKLNDRAQENAKRQSRYDDLGRELQENDESLRNALEAEFEAKANYDELLKQAGAVDEHAFRKRLDIAEQREQLKKEIEQERRHIIEQLGGDDRAGEMEAELELGQIDEWSGEKTRHQESIKILEAERDLAIAHRNDAERERQELEVSANIADCELRLAAVQQELSAVIHTWRVAKLAEQLIKETLERFQRDRQPKVLEFASGHFRNVTAGRYDRIIQRESTLVIRQPDGTELQPEVLSRGTAEQLYLCLRFGLAADFRGRGQLLPLVMDDVLVNFDPERARAVAEVICAVAAEQQVLLFTCHPSTVALFRTIDPTIRLIDLPRYGRPAP